MKKRLFVAIPLPEKLKKSLTAYQQSLDIQDIRFTPKENLHTTVCFIGHVEESIIPSVTDTLASVAAKTRPFALKQHSFTYAPPGKPTRMVWLLFQKNPFFTKLVRRIEEELTKSVPLKHQHATPHITLARIQKRPETELHQQSVLPLEINAITLYESIQSENGQVYIPLHKFPFISKLN